MDQARFSVALTAALGLLIGIPVWWKTTEVHRASLPEVTLNQAVSHKVEIAFRVVQLRSTPERLSGEELSSTFKMRESFAQGLHSEGKSFPAEAKAGRNDEGISMEVHVSLAYATPQSCSHFNELSEMPCKLRWDTSPQVWANLSFHQQDKLLLRLAEREGSSSAYTIFLVETEGHASGADGNPIAVIGKHRHAWITSNSFKECYKTIVPELLRIGRHMYLGDSRSPLIHRSIPNLGGKQTSPKEVARRGRARKHNGPLPLASDGSALLSFTLLNANPADWVVDWNFTAAEEHFVAPLRHTISPVAELTVESQLLYYARGQVRPTWDSRHQAYTVSHSSLPFFVNSNEWHLDTSIAAAGRSKILHLVVYVPAPDECPLHFKSPNGKLSATDGFIVPSWGGVVVWNPASCSREDSRATSPRIISFEDMQKILAVQIGQIRSLFGLPAAPKRLEGVHVLSPGVNGFSDWEVAALLRQQAVEDSREALSTLRALSKLVSELSNMVVQDSISEGLKGALKAAESARTAFVNGSYEMAARAARAARAQAESAFFHPTLMSLLYFPSEHHMAVYMPLFLPVLVNVCAAVFKETLSWGRARSRRRLCEALNRAKRKAPDAHDLTSAKTR